MTSFQLRRRIAALALCITLGVDAAMAAEGVRVVRDLPYRQQEGTSEYERERCRLDLHLPEKARGFPTLVWFHGGGLTAGAKDNAETTQIVQALAADGIAVAAVNYRPSPKVTYPAYIDDAAAAVAWTIEHIDEYGGDSQRVFVGGHSAGGYLTLMVAMDPRYLKLHGAKPADVAGFVPVSGQTITHSTVRRERRIDRSRIIVDQAAPIHHVKDDLPPILTIFADEDLPLRAEENRYFVAAMQAADNDRTKLLQIDDRDHVSVAVRISQPKDPARLAINEFVQATSNDAANH